LLGPGIQGPFDHRHLDQAALARGHSVGQSHQSGEGRVHTRERIAWALGYPGLILDVPGDPRHAAHLFHGLGEADIVAPGAVQAEGGHANQDRAGRENVEVFPAEAEFLEDPRGEVLHHHVAARHEHLSQLEPGGLSQVEREVALVRIGRQVHGAVLPPALPRSIHLGDHPHAVQPLDRLHMNDVGPEHSEHLGGRGTGPPGRAIEDADTFEREGRRTHRHRARRGPGFDPTGVLPDPGSRRPQGTTVAVNPIRGTGLYEGAVRVGHEDAAGSKVILFEHAAAVADRRHRNPELAGPGNDLFGGVLAGPGPDQLVPFGHPGLAPGYRRQLFVGQQVRAFDEPEECLVLRPRVGVEAHPTVGRGLDRGNLDGPMGRPGRLTAEAMHQVGVGVTGDGQAFVQRKVDHLPVPAPARAMDRGQGGHRGEGPADPIGDAAPRLNRWLAGQPALAERAALGLQRELGPGPEGVGTTGPERGDGEDDEARKPARHARGHARRRDAAGIGPWRFDNQVGAIEEGGYLFVFRSADHGALGRVQKPEEGPIPSVELRPGGRPRTQGIAPWRLDLDHVGAGIGEELGAVGAGDPGGEIDDPQIRKAGHSVYASRCCPLPSSP
jgi:hypothetical protein